MGKFCSNCGNELKENADVCLSCGQLINRTLSNQYNVYYTTAEPILNRTSSNQGKTLATVSVVFGSLGFYPLIFIGSIVGLITSLIGINDTKNQYRGRSKIGLGLSIGSLCFWILVFISIAATA